ncbi:galactose-specific lectin nattectin-like [Centroberyx gerrardi]|uniref:galactose-specific lectin nattectin-like n=1 Tax=Centroberyx gerrardi TaxID=166262 RepID=UPI003AADAB85
MASGFHFFMLLCFTSGLMIGETTANGCPDGWTQHGSRCFIFFHSQNIWIDAERACMSYGGNLAAIHTTSEHNFLRELINRVTGSYTHAWIGGFDAVKEGVWMWTDGSSFAYQPWGAGEPNNSGNEHCLEMNFRGSFWNDQQCTDRRSFVCAKDM